MSTIPLDEGYSISMQEVADGLLFGLIQTKTSVGKKLKGLFCGGWGTTEVTAET